MTFQKGNKHGNRFTSTNRPSKTRGKNKIPSIVKELEAMMLDKVEIKDAEGKRKRVILKQAVAKVLIRKALQGDMKALHLLVERMDGKVPETVNHNIEGELKGQAPPIVQIITNDGPATEANG